MTLDVEFVRFGRQMLFSNSSRSSIGQTLNKVNSAKKRVSIGFTPQELGCARKSKEPVVITGFHGQKEAEAVCTSSPKKGIKEFFRSLFSRKKRPKTRQSIGFVSQELTSNRKNKVVKKIGFLNNGEEKVIGKKQQMADGKEVRTTAGFNPQELENRHTVKAIFSSIWENIKLRYKVAAKKQPTRTTMGFNQQEINIHLGDRNIPSVGFLK